MTSSLADEIVAHWASLKRLAQSLLRDPSIADDVLQTAFLKALTTSSQPQSDAKVLPWFKMIVRNTALDIHRQQSRDQQNEMRLAEEEVVLANDTDFETSACRCVTSLLSRLSPDDRRLLVRLDMEGLSLKALSEEMGIPKNTLKVRRHRARKRLKKMLTDICQIGSAKECQSCDCEDEMASLKTESPT